MSVVISAENLVVGYGIRAVATVGSFDVDSSRITVVGGPNGSGKTTLLKSLAGLLPPLDGRIRPTLGMGEGGAVFVHSTPILFAGTVRRNILLASGDDERARHALRRLDVEELWNHDVRRLSAGQRQRIALARGLAARPRMLLVDEPEGGLDPRAVDLWRRVLLEAIDTGGPCIILATHTAVTAEGLPVDTLTLPGFHVP